MRIHLMLIFITVFLLTACKKKEPEDVTSPPKPTKTIPVSQEIKDYAYFKTGSYWIVRNDTTNSTDSVYVSSIQNVTYTLNSSQSDTIISAQQIILKFQSASFHTTYTISSYPNDNVSAHFITSKGNRISFRILELDTLTPAIEIVENSVIPNITIGGMNYSDVRYIDCFFGYVEPSSPQVYYYETNYWKKHVGLLKTKSQFSAMEFGHWEPLSVIRYNVTQ